MLIFRALQFSRLAMLSAFAVESVMSSSSQRRPRAIAATLQQKNFATPLCRYLPPRYRKSIRRFPKLDDQLVRLDLNAGDMSIDETTVINGL
jgi:hypothetical protein